MKYAAVVTQNDDGWTIPLVAIAVDLVILTIRSAALHVLLVERAEMPYEGKPALPGGFLATESEDLDTAAARELTEETGLRAEWLHLEQLRTYGTPNRDPRGRVVSVSYLAIVPDLPEPEAGGDASDANWMPVRQVLRRRAGLAFDHDRILTDGLEHARRKLEHTTLATAFCPPQFTVTELRNVYEIVWGVRLDHRNFYRKVTGTRDFLVPTGTQTKQHGGRPAALFRRGTATALYPPILRGSST
ncbi:NUDIX hydrolase [Actinophytocola xinjiangensis]|uniref:NUDIX hydrolase n=1 Tax=Actinophytocola xinjiangensis TaxID=485602 RepID=A0A7Z0WLV7_9PSEU|nr:NUDIX hydrolase [Actinophytocola xinjiangensis]